MDISTKKTAIPFAYGVIFGFASPIPGVSVGTMAILFNVYDKFFSSINVDTVKKNILSVILFSLGWAGGLFGISWIMMFLFENHGRMISFAFMGLIAGCLPMIYKRATVDKVKRKNVAIFAAALALMVFLAIFGDDLTANNTLEQFGGITPTLLAWLFFACFVSSIAMLIPGVGGSLIMIVFGIYTVYLEAVSTLNAVILIVFGVSMVLGILAGIVITKKLLNSFSQSLYSAILGLIIGSLVVIYPGFSVNLEMLLSIALAGLCFAFAYRLSKV